MPKIPLLQYRVLVKHLQGGQLIQVFTKFTVFRIGVGICTADCTGVWYRNKYIDYSRATELADRGLRTDPTPDEKGLFFQKFGKLEQRFQDWKCITRFSRLYVCYIFRRVAESENRFSCIWTQYLTYPVHSAYCISTRCLTSQHQAKLEI